MKWTSKTYPTYFYLYLSAEQMQEKSDNSKFFRKNRGNPWLKCGMSYCYVNQKTLYFPLETREINNVLYPEKVQFKNWLFLMSKMLKN